MFDIQTLENTFADRINSLENAEKTVREELRSLSRDVLYALHEHGNIDYVNKLMLAKMTPINRKALTLFFIAFTGFHYDEETKQFTKKDKKQYDDKAVKCLDFLEDPLNNFWSWADREVKVQGKAFDPDKFTKYVDNQIKKAEKDGYNQKDIVRALLRTKLTPESLMVIVNTLAVNVPEEQQA